MATPQPEFFRSLGRLWMEPKARVRIGVSGSGRDGRQHRPSRRTLIRITQPGEQRGSFPLGTVSWAQTFPSVPLIFSSVGLPGHVSFILRPPTRSVAARSPAASFGPAKSQPMTADPSISRSPSVEAPRATSSGTSTARSPPLNEATSCRATRRSSPRPTPTQSRRPSPRRNAPRLMACTGATIPSKPSTWRTFLLERIKSLATRSRLDERMHHLPRDGHWVK